MKLPVVIMMLQGAVACVVWAGPIALLEDGYHVHAGQSIQKALDLAARNPTNKTVWVHEGVYRPTEAGLAFVWFNKNHDGVRLIARGNVTLTAANPDLANPRSPSYPAIVNHVVYFGDGIGSGTLFQGFQVTGANDHFSTNAPVEIEPNQTLEKGLFFYGDGGGIKIFGRSYPVLDNVDVVDNYANPCAGGVSIEHDGHGEGISPQPVVIRNSVLRSNRTLVNGAALDLLIGSHAVVSNCLFVLNAGNLGFNYVTDPNRPAEFTNAAVLCVFPNARIEAVRCTFAANRNGVHDQGQSSLYQDCIFYNNTLKGGYYTSARYDLHIEGKANVVQCFIGGTYLDPNNCIHPDRNYVDVSAPDFDERCVPQAPAFRKAGYRPANVPFKVSVPLQEADVLKLMNDRDRMKYQGARPKGG